MNWDNTSEMYVDQVVQKNEQGEIVVYPYGLFGRGYLLPAGDEQKFRNRLYKATHIPLFIASLIGLPLAHATRLGMVSWPLFAAIVSVLLGGILYAQWQLTAGLQPAAARVSIGERFRRGRQARAPRTYWQTIGIGLFLAPVGAGMAAFANGNWFVIGTGIMLVGLSAVGIIDGVLGLIERSRSR